MMRSPFLGLTLLIGMLSGFFFVREAWWRKHHTTGRLEAGRLAVQAELEKMSPAALVDVMTKMQRNGYQVRADELRQLICARGHEDLLPVNSGTSPPLEN
jgi:hypothetical protein